MQPVPCQKRMWRLQSLQPMRSRWRRVRFSQMHNSSLGKGCGLQSLCSKKRGRNPCNPCAAKKNACGACNLCAAKKRGCGACNPCAAKKHACNPCNPCAAKNPCGAANPCNPCGGNAQFVEVTNSEATAAYNCLKGEIAAAYAKAGVKSVNGYQNWAVLNKAPYVADTHGGRLVNNFTNRTGKKAYGRYEKVGKCLSDRC